MKFLLSAILVLITTSASALPQKICEVVADQVVQVAGTRDNGVSYETNKNILLSIGNKSQESINMTEAIVGFVYLNPHESPTVLGIKFYALCLNS